MNPAAWQKQTKMRTGPPVKHAVGEKNTHTRASKMPAKTSGEENALKGWKQPSQNIRVLFLGPFSFSAFPRNIVASAVVVVIVRPVSHSRAHTQ